MALPQSGSFLASASGQALRKPSVGCLYSNGRKQRKSPSTANSLRKARRGSECSATAGELSVDSGEDAKHIWNEYFEFEVDHVEDTPDPPTTRHLIGMRNWRLGAMVCLEHEFLTSEIEGFWRQFLQEDLQLSTLHRSKKFFDSLDPDGSKGETFTRKTDDPAPTEYGYPRMIMESREYCSLKFRKLHINVQMRQDGVEVMHCLMVPFTQFDLPIFTMEMIGVDGNITFCSVDLIPTSKSGKLSEPFDSGVKLLQDVYVKSNKDVPEWLKSVGSQKPLVTVPENENEVQDVIAYVGLLAKAYLKSSEIVERVPMDEVEGIQMAHERFYHAASANAKSRSLVQASFADSRFVDTFFGGILHDLMRNADDRGFAL